MRLALVAGAAVVIAVALAAPAISEGTTESTTPNVTIDPCIAHPHPAREQRHLERRTWPFGRWRDRTPARAVELARMRLLRSCANHAALPAMRKGWRQAKARFYMNRSYRLVAPYPGFSGEGYWLRWLAIPSYVVACETQGYSGDGRWLARNSSGAQGPAQLLGWPAPYPAMSDHERLRYWQVARMVWESSGPGAWACA